jgi:DNA-nicking Smr family endonuclease
MSLLAMWAVEVSRSFFNMKSKIFNQVKANLKAEQAQSLQKKLDTQSKQTPVNEDKLQFSDELTFADTQGKLQPNLVQDTLLFQQAIGKVKPMVVDTTPHVRKRPSGEHGKSALKAKKTSNTCSKSLAQFHFSDEFEPLLNKQGPLKYVREGVDSFEVKNLRRGHYTPDLILDLHGLDQNQAKKELAALLYACQKEHAQCICIVHGLGSHILKNKVPHWLVQHPDVMAFHQAPLEWGGNGAVLALIEIHDKFAKF